MDETTPAVLATDLDGTLIPLDGNTQNAQDLRTLEQQFQQHGARLVFVTGRHFESVEHAIGQHRLPTPYAVICDVGTTIRERNAAGELTVNQQYRAHLQEIIAPLPKAELRERLAAIDGLTLQEEEKQGEFKLSYYAPAQRLDELAKAVLHQLHTADAPYSLIHSVDPFTGDGLLDLLPKEVSKAHALNWWIEQSGAAPHRVAFAGDSGNDTAALISGHQSIVVGNADAMLKRQIADAHREVGWRNRLYLAEGQATTGVLEGCRWFELIPPQAPPTSPLGATPLSVRQSQFRVWAPDRRTVAVRHTEGDSARDYPLERGEGGYFQGVAPVGVGDCYWYVLDGGPARPDPVSRYQPEGVHGPSQVVAPSAFVWTDHAWPGVVKRDLVIYELHVGAFTESGTLRGAIDRLPELVELGVTAIELMPVCQSPGAFNWGYDGVNLYAVRDTYGHPDDLRALVDACHAAGLAVILDVVYNHVGPEGNYLSDFGPYASRKHHTPWGDALNFDGRHSQPVRRFVVENALYWLNEYHLDGLRLDAMHFMHDDSEPSILDEISTAVADFKRGCGREIALIAEANVYEPEVLSPPSGAPPYDAIWCDCLMHALYSHGVPSVQLTGRDYRGAADVAEALEHGYLYFSHQYERADQSHRTAFHSESRTEPHRASLIIGLQTHDAVGNHPHGWRLHQLVSKDFQRAAAALVLLYPGIPLLFMGEETACDSPFPFFTDFQDRRLRRAVNKGRAKEYPSHLGQGAPQATSESTYLSARCFDPDQHDPAMREWYRRLLALRKEGLAAGWLTPENLTTEWRPQQDLFVLRYQTEATTATVYARLAKQDQPATINAEGRVRLCSVGEHQDARGELALQPNHAVVVIDA